jgi:succinate-semialdehyde dehydrogenase/glutarate-semialdehyde dehydrogenase
VSAVIDLKPMVRSTPIDLFIGGSWRPATDGQRIPVLNPATGAELVSVASGSVDDGLAAVTAAYETGPGWAATAPRTRAEILRRAFELMTERAEQLAVLIVLENGKILADARSEVAYAAEFFRWYAEEAVRGLGSVQTAPSGRNRIMVMRQPIGVSVLVTPWNFPAAMATRKIGPALAAGCTVVLKPASETPLTALAIAEILAEAGVPAGVVNVLPSCRSGPVVRAMLDDLRVRKLSFTGSTEVGRRLLTVAADSVVSSSMELGGNAPFLVFADADLDTAVRAAMVAKMRNGGEACTAANRFYVQRPVVEQFTRRLACEMGDLRLGSGLDERVQLGPLVNAESRQKVARLVDETMDMGATARTGGSPVGGQGFFYPATVLADVPPGAPVLSEEIFGPVAPVVAFDTEAEAIELANDTVYGLVSYVCTSDLTRGLRVAEALDCGMVGLNRGVVSDPAAPFGGTKQSGLGREGGHEGLLEFTESKYIAVQW